MIVPLTEEEVWASLLAHLPEWRPSASPMLVIAPHPDDEILGIGGLIAAQRTLGVDVTVVAVTDGENAYSNVADPVALGRERRREQTAALQRVGVPEDRIVRLQLPDSNVMAHLPKLIDLVSPWVTPQTHLLAPWRGDFHPDHEACGLMAEAVAHNTGATLTSYFFWTWHRGTPALVEDLPLRRFPLNSSQLVAKADALACHRSQLFREPGEPILPPSLLGPAQRPFEVFLVQGGSMKEDTLSQSFFEKMYQRTADPWGFASSDYEQSRYQAILRALDHRTYQSAFEPGCSIGVLTAQLADICRHVQAMDISLSAVHSACIRCKDLPHVEITCGAFPQLLPSGPFDLIVLSEIGYYLSEPQLSAAGATLAERLHENGTLIAAHWLGASADHILSGDRVHEILGNVEGLVLEHSERHEKFRLDRWVRPCVVTAGT